MRMKKMGYGQYQSPESEGKVSEYNAAAFKMKRLHDVQEELNLINGNLLAYNDEYGIYNYKLKFIRCDTLFLEVESKLKPNERKDANALRDAIRKAIDKHPVYESKKGKAYPYKQNMKINNGVWKVLEDWLFRYETLVRKLLDDHGMDTKYDDDQALF